MFRFLRHGMSENPIDEETGTEMKQEIQQMVACGALSIEGPVDEERTV